MIWNSSGYSYSYKWFLVHDTALQLIINTEFAISIQALIVCTCVGVMEVKCVKTSAFCTI